MRTSITLIAKPGTAELSQWAEQCCAALNDAGLAATVSMVLSAAEALDIYVAATDTVRVRELATAALAQQPVDMIVQDAARRKKRLLVADMESTIIQQEMLEEMADAIGKRAEVTAITQRAMNGELDFAAALRERVALFAGLPATLLDDMAARITLMPGAATLVATMRQHGATCWLASGGFRVYTQLIAARLGFDSECANELLIADGALTGQVAEPILDKNSKLAVLERGVAELGITLQDTLTVGDGANDLAMIGASSAAGGLGIAFRAKPNVQAQATHRINHGDLTALLFAQGYRREEFIITT